MNVNKSDKSVNEKTGQVFDYNLLRAKSVEKALLGRNLVYSGIVAIAINFLALTFSSSEKYLIVSGIIKCFSTCAVLVGTKVLFDSTFFIKNSIDVSPDNGGNAMKKDEGAPQEVKKKTSQSYIGPTSMKRNLDELNLASTSAM